MSPPASPPEHEPLLQIGEIAERTGLSLRTVRYYEEMELVVPASRTTGGFRLYDEDHVGRLELIKQMKPLGFSIQEMRELLDAQETVRGQLTPDADEARQTLLRFADLAAERLEKRRRQLAGAAGLSRSLRETAAHPDVPDR